MRPKSNGWDDHCVTPGVSTGERMTIREISEVITRDFLFNKWDGKEPYLQWRDARIQEINDLLEKEIPNIGNRNVLEDFV